MSEVIHLTNSDSPGASLVAAQEGRPLAERAGVPAAVQYLDLAGLVETDRSVIEEVPVPDKFGGGVLLFRTVSGGEKEEWDDLVDPASTQVNAPKRRRNARAELVKYALVDPADRRKRLLRTPEHVEAFGRQPFGFVNWAFQKVVEQGKFSEKDVKAAEGNSADVPDDTSSSS